VAEALTRLAVAVHAVVVEAHTRLVVRAAHRAAAAEVAPTLPVADHLLQAAVLQAADHRLAVAAAVVEVGDFNPHPPFPSPFHTID